MILAFRFMTPLLLVGLLAAAIPFVLHLLSSVRAQQVYFPTLRFLRLSMEKTARRRRIQHWLLLVLRAALLGLLALGLAEPISRATGTWLGGQNKAAVIILDNSYSMAARRADGTRFSAAKAQAANLLGGPEKPTLAALASTCGGAAPGDLTARLADVRSGLEQTVIGYEAASLAQRVSEALELLKKRSAAQKAVYIFSDLQRTSFEPILTLPQVRDNDDAYLMIVNLADEQVNNVGITDLEIEGRRVVNAVLQLTVTLTNSSPTDRVVTVAMRVGGSPAARSVRKRLRAAGKEGSSGTVRFRPRFAQPGLVAGEIALDIEDDLLTDNTRRFCLNIGPRVKALVVRGQAGEVAALDPALMLRLALEPYAGETVPWPIAPETVEAEQFDESHLRGADAAFFCEMPRFTEAQALAVAKFVAAGGTAFFFLGEGVDTANYNERFVQNAQLEPIVGPGGLLPARLGATVGQIGPEAQAVGLGFIDVDHPYFTGLYDNITDYLRVLTHRCVRLEGVGERGRVLMRLKDGRPLMVSLKAGEGTVVLCTTSASPKWTNLPLRALFLPMVVRAALLARDDVDRNQTYLAGAHVKIRPRGEDGSDLLTQDSAMTVTIPGGEGGEAPEVRPLKVQQVGVGTFLAAFTETRRLGTYNWQASEAGRDDRTTGSFVVNPHGAESQLESFASEVFRQAVARRSPKGGRRVYVAPSLQAAHDAALADAEGRNWWDQVLAVVIVLLVAEAVIANRGKRGEAVPAHLNPKLAG